MTIAQRDARAFVATATEASKDEQRLVRALREGDEQAFASLLDLYHGSLVRFARLFLRCREDAEDVAQETWLGVVRGLNCFEGRSSLKTWIFRILSNIARSRAAREGRTIPFSSLPGPDDEPFEPSVEPERFLDSGRWASAPASWCEMPEGHLLSWETLERVREAINRLAPVQRQVISLRDIEGWSSEEVCALLKISPENQRVLLHRARSRVRRELEAYVAGA